MVNTGILFSWTHLGVAILGQLLIQFPVVPGTNLLFSLRSARLLLGNALFGLLVFLLVLLFLLHSMPLVHAMGVLSFASSL